MGFLKDRAPDARIAGHRAETVGMRTAAKIVIATVSTVALAGGIGAGLAYADPTDPAPTPTASATPTPSASPTAKPRDHTKPRRGLLGRAVHGEVTLAGKRHRVVVFQRGPAETVSTTALTVKSADGYTASYVLNAETKVRKNREQATVADLEAGDRIRVVATRDGGTLTALRVRAFD